MSAIEWKRYSEIKLQRTSSALKNANTRKLFYFHVVYSFPSIRCMAVCLVDIQRDVRIRRVSKLYMDGKLKVKY